MRLKGKKVAILVSNEFEDIEVFYPFLRLSEEGAWITFGIYQRGFHPRPAFPGKPITGRFGLTVPPMFHREGYRYDVKEATELSAEEYDAVIIPGGFSLIISEESQRLQNSLERCTNRARLWPAYVMVPGL